MNVFQLLITAIIAVAVLYVIGTQIAPLFTQETNLSSYAQTLLVEAQGDLGHAKGATLSLRAGQTLYARNLDTPTRTVAFACATPACCSSLSGCTQPLSASGDHLLTNQNVKTTLSARCISNAGIHTCKIYAGNVPAQVEMTPLSSIPAGVDINGQKELPVEVVIQNTGMAPANGVTVSVDLLEKQVSGTGETDAVIDHDETSILALENGKTARVNLTLLLQRTGNFTLRITAEGEDAGRAMQTKTITVTGTELSLCEPDTARDEPAVIDSFINECRKKVYCSACDFAFQCRNAWKEQYPLDGVQYYDENRGEKGFAYVLSPLQNGVC